MLSECCPMLSEVVRTIFTYFKGTPSACQAIRP
jgi:hypothetical protein